MEILGGEFEDSVFIECRNRDATKTEAYTAKQCEPQWFSAEISSKDGVEIVTVKKFNGDFAYRQKDFQVFPREWRFAARCNSVSQFQPVAYRKHFSYTWKPEKALQEYTDCLSLLSSSNVAMRRDVQEGQARCLCHMGRHTEALDIAQTLRNGSTNTDHLTTVLNLQVAIHQSVGNVQRVILSLQQLIALYPFNPWHWRSLAEAYWELLQDAHKSCSMTKCQILAEYAESGQGVEIQSFVLNSNERTESHCPTEQSSNDISVPGISAQSSRNICIRDIPTPEMTLSTSPESEKKQLQLGSPAPMEVKRLWMKSCASFIRTRLLLQLVQSQQSSFVLENNLKAQMSTDEKLKGFGLNEDTLMLITEVLGEDLAQERLRDEQQSEGKAGVTAALATFVIASEDEFEDRWFGSVKDHLEPLHHV